MNQYAQINMDKLERFIIDRSLSWKNRNLLDNPLVQHKSCSKQILWASMTIKMVLSFSTTGGMVSSEGAKMLLCISTMKKGTKGNNWKSSLHLWPSDRTSKLGIDCHKYQDGCFAELLIWKLFVPMSQLPAFITPTPRSTWILWIQCVHELHNYENVVNRIIETKFMRKC